MDKCGGKRLIETARYYSKFAKLKKYKGNLNNQLFKNILIAVLYF